MNSYERIYNVLMEEALVIEQKRGRAKLMATAGVLGALTAGLQGTGKTKAPAPPKPSTTQTVAAKRKAPELPSVKRSSRTVATTTSEKPTAPEKTETAPKAPTTKNLGPSRSSLPSVVPYRDDGPQSDMDWRERNAKLRLSIDQKQAKIDHENRKKKWKGIPYK